MNRLKEHLLPFLIMATISSLSVAIFPPGEKVPVFLESLSTLVLFGIALLVGAWVVVSECGRAERNRFTGRRISLLVLIWVPVAVCFGFAALALFSLAEDPPAASWRWIQGYCSLGIALEAVVLAICYAIVLLERLFLPAGVE